jgi:hypothetical protein
MASYTDAITQFNPYIAQQPVEAMVKVGMQKQELYNEGIQKIQTGIDNTAALDILRGVDKNYLQSKLDELGSNLTKVAGGDFSNFQLVNSVGGMTNQIVKDKNVQAAVGSTAWYRKQAAEMEDAITKGTSSQSNIWDFNEKTNNYMSSTDLGRSFNDRYVPYTDYQKKWTEVLGKLHSKLTQEDITHVMDANGNVDPKRLAAAMTRVKDEGVTANQIETAIRATLNSNDLQQLQIDGRYQFRGASVGDLQTHYKNIYDGNIKSIDSKITQLTGLANASASNPVFKDKLLETIDELKNKKSTLTSNLATTFDEITKNPDAAKVNIFKEGALSQFANAFAWENRILEKMNNPELDAEHWEKDFGIKRSELNLRNSEFTWKKYVDKKNLEREAAKLQLEIDKVRGITGGFKTYLGENTKLDNPVVAMQSDANSAAAQANKTIEEYAKEKGISISAAEQLYKDYINGKTDAIDVTWRKNMDLVHDNRIKADNINQVIKNTDVEVSNDPIIKEGKKQLDALLASKKGVSLTYNGTIYTFSPQELLSYYNKEQAVGNTSINTLGVVTGGTSLRMDRAKLTTAKEKILYNIVSNSRYFSGESRNNPEVSNAEKALQQFGDVSTASSAFNTIYEKKKEDILLSKSGKYIPSLANINVGNEEGSLSRANMEGVATSVLSRFADPLGGTFGGSSVLSHGEAVAALKWFNDKDKGNIQYKKIIQGDDTYMLLMKGSDQVLIPLTYEEAVQLPKGKDELSSQEVDIKQLQIMGNGNTNILGNTETSHFQSSSFRNVRKLRVTADLNIDRTLGSGLQYINLNIKLPSGWKNLQLDDYPMDNQSAINRIASMTDNDIKDIYLRDDKVPESWKNEIRNLK